MNALDPLTAIVFELLNFFLALDSNALFLAAGDLRRHAATISDLVASVGDVDAAIAVASFQSAAPA